MVKSAGRWGLVERNHCRQCARVGVEPVLRESRLGTGYLRCEKPERDQRGLRIAFRERKTVRERPGPFWQRSGERLVGEQSGRSAIWVSVHAATQLQPLE